ncbi:MAG: DUF927 domain-containing protein [Ilumatobacteraceae bacterium]
MNDDTPTETTETLDGLDLLRVLQNQLSSAEKSNHLAAWATIQRVEALGAIADAWVANEAQVSGMLAVIEMLPGQTTRTRALRNSLKRIVADRRRASLDRVIGVVQDNTLISVGIALGAGAPPASLVEPQMLDNLRVPRGYSMDPTGVFKLSVMADGTAASTRVATAPVFIVGRSHDVLTGTAKRVLMWRTPAGWTMRPLDRGVLMNSQKLIGLADLEVPVTSNTAAGLVEWLSEFEAENTHRFGASQAASRMGWLNQGGVQGFLLPDVFYTTSSGGEGEEAVELVPQIGLESILEGWKPGGSWEGWLEAMETMRPFTPMWLALYASCAAPMLEIIGSPSFVVDFNGETSSGKTTAMRVAASVWGRPADNMPTAMYSWDSTKVFIERLCGFLCHLPVILDETKRAKDPKIVRDVVYDFANGQGRGRGAPDGTRQTASWRSVMLTSGEAAATSFSQDGGTRARVLSITGKPMGTNMKDGGPAAESLAAQLQENYGHLGRKLMHYLVGVADQHEALREVWRSTRDQYAAVARTAVSRRHAGNLATLHLASTIVHESLGVPYPEEDPMHFALEAVMRIETEKDRPHAAFIEVAGWCAANQNRFWGRHELDRDNAARVPGRGWAGAWDKRDDWSCISVMPHILREILEPMGFTVEEIIDRWSERGWIMHTSRFTGGKEVRSRTTVVRINGAPMRVYQFARMTIDTHVADDEVLRGDADV